MTALSSPNPTSGFLLFCPRDEVIYLDMSVEDAVKLVVSGGIVHPPEPAAGKRAKKAAGKTSTKPADKTRAKKAVRQAGARGTAGKKATATKKSAKSATKRA